MDPTTEGREKMAEHPGGEELARLLQRAEQGDLSALPALREVLDANAPLWREYGDLEGEPARLDGPAAAEVVPSVEDRDRRDGALQRASDAAL